jgi:hypothetical protein
MKFAGAGTAAALMGSAALDAQAAPPSTAWGLANVKDSNFGARGDGVTSDEKAFQAAVDYAASKGWGGIYVPPGKYKLSKPVQVPGFMTIQGVGGIDYDKTQGTIILPATVAFMPKSTAYTSQEMGFTCRNIVFVGGTIPIDLGLRHECVFSDLTFIDPEIAAISIVRGERHSFTNIHVYPQNVGTKYGLALASPSITTIPGLGDIKYVNGGFNYAPEGGPWIDRVSVDKLAFTYGNAHLQNGIYCEGMLSNFNSQHIVFHGIRGGYLLYVGERLQFSHITNVVIDQCSTSGALVSIKHSKQNVFTDVSPGSSENNLYGYGIAVTWSDYTVLINCNVAGDNSSQYGIFFGPGVGQMTTLIDCKGALYLDTPSYLQKNRITQLGCSWSASNIESSVSLSSVDNRNIMLQLMADLNGAQSATSSVKIVAAQVGGNSRTILDASVDSVAIGLGTWDGVPVRFGARYEWYDVQGNKRAKVGKPDHDADGVIISAQRVV